MSTITLTAENFQNVIESNDIVLIDFWAPWCGPCKAFGPVFEKASDKHPGMVFAKINTDDQQELASAFNIRSIPTLMVFREKVLLFAQPGMLPAAGLEELIGKVQGLDMQAVHQAVKEQSEKASPSA